jgi:hypothetical protein
MTELSVRKHVWHKSIPVTFKDWALFTVKAKYTFAGNLNHLKFERIVLWNHGKS